MTKPKAISSQTLSPAARLLLRGLDNRWERYENCFQICCQEFSKEAVHDLRVTNRRLLNIIEIFERSFLGMKGHKLRRDLKGQLDNLDLLMDIQVQIAFVTDEMAEVEGISVFQKYLSRREAKLLKDVEKLVQSLSIAHQKRRLNNFRSNAEARLQVPHVRARLIAAVDNSYAYVLQRYSRIDPQKTETIHRTRIAFKSFRYAVEVIYPLIAHYPMELLKEMNGYQGYMGDIQDIEVLQGLLKAFGKKHSTSDVSSPQAFVDERHRLLLETFLSHKDALYDFWRYSPRQSYPWNKART